MLIISDHPNSEVLPFERSSILWDKFIIKSEPKYVSIYSAENNCIPMFLKQKNKEVEPRYMNVDECDRNDCICRIKPSKENTNYRYARFNP